MHAQRAVAETSDQWQRSFDSYVGSDVGSVCSGKNCDFTCATVLFDKYTLPKFMSHRIVHCGLRAFASEIAGTGHVMSVALHVHFWRQHLLCGEAALRHTQSPAPHISNCTIVKGIAAVVIPALLQRRNEQFTAPQSEQANTSLMASHEFCDGSRVAPPSSTHL